MTPTPMQTSEGRHRKSPRRAHMQQRQDTEAMVRELREAGLDEGQERRLDEAFEAAKVAAVAVMCARYGTDEAEMLESLQISQRLNDEACTLLERVEVSSEYIGYIHSGFQF
jgi:hypothetical protein